MIFRTLPEPLCDVTAQLAALMDPDHPKDAVWLASGTPQPQMPAGCMALTLPEGTLITRDPAKIEALQSEPHDDRLAVVLGYVEPKSRLSGLSVVMQARDPMGNVITEMAVSPLRAGEAAKTLARHGEVGMTTLLATLVRRQILAQWSDGNGSF